MPTVEQTIAEYLKAVQPKIADPFHPHPIVKAIMVAVEASKDGKDANYMGVSGDADLHRGVAHLSYSAVIKKEGNSFQILEIRDIMNGLTVRSDSVERMIDAEIEMLNFDGDTIPVDAAVQILDRAIGPKFRVVKLDEKKRTQAIALAKELLREGRLRDLPSPVCQEIEAITATTGWASLSPEARAAIGNAWATRIGPNTIVVTHVDGQVPRIKIREMIAATLVRS